MESLNEKENAFEEHYYSFEQRGYPFDSERAQYLSKFAKLRTGMGNKYLAYGKMLRPLDFECEKVNLNWFLYNCDKNFKEYNDSGELAVDSIVHSAWQYRDESIGLFFANVSNEKRTIKINLDRKKMCLPQNQLSVQLYSDNEVKELMVLEIDDAEDLEFSVPEKTVVLVELVEL
jgi:hypothetical protein